MYYFGAYLLKIILSLFGRIKVYQKENVPQSGGYVIACTHTGWVDILWLGVSMLPIKIHYMAKKELFESRFLKWLIDRKSTRLNSSHVAISYAVFCLKKKNNIRPAVRLCVQDNG